MISFFWKTNSEYISIRFPAIDRITGIPVHQPAIGKQVNIYVRHLSVLLNANADKMVAFQFFY